MHTRRSSGARGRSHLQTIPNVEERHGDQAGMTRSTRPDHHDDVGQLPRSQAVTEVLFAREREESRDSAADDARHYSGRGEVCATAGGGRHRPVSGRR